MMCVWDTRRADVQFIIPDFNGHHFPHQGDIHNGMDRRVSTLVEVRIKSVPPARGRAEPRASVNAEMASVRVLGWRYSCQRVIGSVPVMRGFWVQTQKWHFSTGFSLTPLTDELVCDHRTDYVIGLCIVSLMPRVGETC